MEILNFPYDQLKIFLLVLIRISCVLFLFPIFGSKVFPNLVKAGLALVMALALTPVVKIDLTLFPENTVTVVIFIASEIFIGLVLGLSIRLFFASVQFAGQLIGFQTGFMMANVIDPQSGTQVSLIEQFAYWIALIIFLILDGHHMLITAMVQSFDVINVGIISLKKELLSQMLLLSSNMFILAIKIGSPAIAALLFTSAGFGLCARFVPQMNILIVSFPFKIAVGLIFLGITFQIISIVTQIYCSNFLFLLFTLVKMLGNV